MKERERLTKQNIQQQHQDRRESRRRIQFKGQGLAGSLYTRTFSHTQHHHQQHQPREKQARSEQRRDHENDNDDEEEEEEEKQVRRRKQQPPKPPLFCYE